MGHERLGTLPRTKEWRQLVKAISAVAEGPAATPALATATLLQVRRRFEQIPVDAGFRAAFAFIVGLATEEDALSDRSSLYPQIDLGSNPSAVRLTSQLRAWVDQHAGSLEYAELSKRAAADVIAFWTGRHARQEEMFAEGFTQRLSSKAPKFANRIREYRLKAGLTQRALGAALGVTRRAISAWERGLSCPTVPSLMRLAKTLGTLAESLYFSFYTSTGTQEAIAARP
jgi:DNA-binding XRE family transcriptional regulator